MNNKLYAGCKHLPYKLVFGNIFTKKTNASDE